MCEPVGNTPSTVWCAQCKGRIYDKKLDSINSAYIVCIFLLLVMITTSAQWWPIGRSGNFIPTQAAAKT